MLISGLKPCGSASADSARAGANIPSPCVGKASSSESSSASVSTSTPFNASSALIEETDNASSTRSSPKNESIFSIASGGRTPAVSMVCSGVFSPEKKLSSRLSTSSGALPSVAASSSAWKPLTSSGTSEKAGATASESPSPYTDCCLSTVFSAIASGVMVEAMICLKSSNFSTSGRRISFTSSFERSGLITIFSRPS